jgi:pyruvoyl-dependent arginine decarboxylase-like protein
LTPGQDHVKLRQEITTMAKGGALRYSEIGCRIPKEYFWVIGWGESDVGIETGSYDAALHMAGIENYNVMLYT